MHKFALPDSQNFPRNLYSVNNATVVWECDLVDVEALSKYNDKLKYLLTVVDLFSKYMYVLPLKWMTGPTVTSAFQSTLRDPKYILRRTSKPVHR